MRHIVFALIFVFGIMLVIFAGTETRTSAQDPAVTPWEWNLPPGFPESAVPEDNPMTVEKVELGRYLFYDPRLSGNGVLSCSTCHIQGLAFTDGRAVSAGSTGETTPRNSMSLTNVTYNGTFTWAHPALIRIEQQLVIPMFGETPIEMGITGNEEEVLDRLRSDETYQELFAAAYPDQEDPFNFNAIVQAISSFVRTMISGNSAFDRFAFQGQRDAMSESAILGMNLFYSERFECFHCHTGFNFTISTVHSTSAIPERPFFNTGLYNVDGEGGYPAPNRGVYEISGELEDMGAFRPPTLRNVEVTGPYMHDGSMETLEEVVDFYAAAGRNIEEGEFAGDGRENPLKNAFVIGFEATELEKQALIDFLKSLTDDDFLTNPAFSNPFETAEE
ncbi:MAG: di-heme enzyme [Chloroflexi bacterium]|nr:di-heme enzyme [Chloroflexota bacterium]